MHQEAHFKQPAFIRDVIIGLSDGITVPFALTAGISGVLSATSGNALIITAGIAEIAAGSISMGLGGFLAGKSEVDFYFSELDREHREVREVPEIEKKEVKEIFAGYGLSEDSQNIVVNELAKDEGKFVDFMMRYELGLEKPDLDRARKSALNIALSYVIGGLIPLLGYVFTETPMHGLRDSSIFTIMCLLTFGYLRSRYTGQEPIKGALKTTGIGILAAAAAFGIAYAFNHR
jgi:VIT1/CCC1 family predicted Fe2+/Mn2+ transporter